MRVLLRDGTIKAVLRCHGKSEAMDEKFTFLFQTKALPFWFTLSQREGLFLT